MASKGVLIVGESGSGKTTAVESLPPSETFIINVVSKDLPFKGWKKNYTLISQVNPQGNLFNGDNTALILKTMDHVSKNMPQIKYLVIDD